MIRKINIENVSKNFGNIHALDNVSFDIPKNSIFGILGSNGSGKTTLMKIMSGLIKKWSGSILFNDKKYTNQNLNLSNQFGFLIENPCFYEFLSARQNLEMLLRISNRTENHIKDIVESVNLTSRIDDKVETYSYGMKQRLGLAQTLLHDPEILVIDEPNNGLDPLGISEMNQIIKNLHDSGKTIIMSSHILNEIELLCTDVCILKHGKVLITESLTDLKEKSNIYTIEVDDIENSLKDLENIDTIKIIKHINNYITFSSDQKLDTSSINSLLNSKTEIYQFKKDVNLLKYFHDN
ncbi:MAG: ABC transporter ATP-binding protein [Candidatus Neomarinimicrobiota bacterium]|nr:ABC transporter ATP-binding protein [Candidatus Neomarinimicrobiota bacterium]|tara:strand:+ start:115 stop:999 length:885 start_codon:yes stop_codon:yes gene_type:complete